MSQPVTEIKLASIFRTIDGEVTSVGPWRWSTFVRFGGCNLRCWKSSGHCDAPESLDINRAWGLWTIDEILKVVLENGTPNVTITGGEPLLQPKGVVRLSKLLHRHGLKITLETSGSKDLSVIDNATLDCVVMDVKCPSTEMSKFNVDSNMRWLGDADFAKFVIQDRYDFDWALKHITNFPTIAKVAFSPRYGYMSPRELFEWLEEAKRFDIQLNLQTHKYIFPECEPKPVDNLKDIDYEKLLNMEK